MLSSAAHLLLAYCTVATAVPLPAFELGLAYSGLHSTPAPPTSAPTTPAPTTQAPTVKRPAALPFCDDLKTSSVVQQGGFTSGGAALSSRSATQGSAAVKCVVRGPQLAAQLAAAGNSGVSGTGVSAGNGIFQQGVKAATKVKSGGNGVDVTTASAGTGKSGGGAAINQSSGANVGANLKIVGAGLLQTSELGLATIKNILQGGAKSSSGHKGSGSGNSALDVVNQSGTSIVFDKLSPPAAPPTTPAPTTTPAPSTPAPDTGLPDYFKFG